MHQITDRLFVGNIYDSAQPPAQVSALLLVAEEYQLEAGIEQVRLLRQSA